MSGRAWVYSLLVAAPLWLGIGSCWLACRPKATQHAAPRSTWSPSSDPPPPALAPTGV